MPSRFLQGDGYPILYRYNSSNVLQQTVNMPYVRDDGSKSYVKQYFDPYPEVEALHHKLLSGAIAEDKPVGHKARFEIKYSSILATDLDDIFNCILTSLATAGNYLKLKPRNDHDGTYLLYKVVYGSNIHLDSNNMWQHNVLLPFSGMELISTSLTMEIPPVIP